MTYLKINVRFLGWNPKTIFIYHNVIYLILTVHRMSQWIVPSNDQALLSAVSSTLDKLQSAKRDPIVKYDQRTAVWTYLHRHR